MHVLLIGHKGWIGSMMMKLLETNDIPYITTSIRPEQKKEFEDFVIQNKPTHIMSFIGRTHGGSYTTIDYLQQADKLQENVRDNLFSPMVIALLCQKHNIHFTYLGTGCIFTYDEKHIYGNETTGFTEEDTPNFFGSNYSIVKGYTDELMSLLQHNILNIRIRMPITNRNEPRNFISKILKYEYICSIPNSMTVLDELLPYVLDMAKKQLTGTINLTNPGLITHNEILEMYRTYCDNTFTWKNFNIDQQNKILSSERSNNCLATTKLQTLYPEVKHIRESIRNTLMKWNK